MRFTASKTELQKAVKTAIKAVNQNNIIPGLKGLLFEVNENNGVISITGSDLRTQITSRLKSEHIETGGKIVIGTVLNDMLNLLKGETVEIYTEESIVTVKSEPTEYKIPFLDADGFAKAETVFPSNNIRIQSINSLIQNTVFVSEKNVEGNERKSLEFVKISFANGGTKAEATNGNCIAIASNPHCADGDMEMILHESTLHTLASLLKADEELFVGISGNYAVFLKEDMIFQTFLYTGKYFDSNMFLSRIVPKYTAVTDAKEFYRQADNATAIFDTGDDKCLNLSVTEDRICIGTLTKNNSSKTYVMATETVPTPSAGFYFKAKYLLDCLKHTSGPVRVTFDGKGFMLIIANQNIFCISPRGPIKIVEDKPIKKVKEPKAEKPKKAKSENAKKTKKTAKAA